MMARGSSARLTMFYQHQNQFPFIHSRVSFRPTHLEAHRLTPHIILKHKARLLLCRVRPKIGDGERRYVIGNRGTSMGV
jgi:hypothetical protein